MSIFINGLRRQFTLAAISASKSITTPKNLSFVPLITPQIRLISDKKNTAVNGKNPVDNKKGKQTSIKIPVQTPISKVTTESLLSAAEPIQNITRDIGALFKKEKDDFESQVKAQKKHALEEQYSVKLTDDGHVILQREFEGMNVEIDFSVHEDQPLAQEEEEQHQHQDGNQDMITVLMISITDPKKGTDSLSIGCTVNEQHIIIDEIGIKEKTSGLPVDMLSEKLQKRIKDYVTKLGVNLKLVDMIYDYFYVKGKDEHLKTLSEVTTFFS